MNDKRVAITTLGCKANQYDSAVLTASCQQSGWDVVPFHADADAYIVNTCTVTRRADVESRQLLRRARRRNPEAMLIATGCYAEVAADELQAVEGVTHVIGTSHRHDVLRVLHEAWGGDAVDTQQLVPPTHRVRPFLKIQDGCDLYCTYCIIPRARGHQRSWPVTDVLAHLAAYHDAGYDEAVLTGIHIGTYGRDLDPLCRLTDLLRVIIKRRPIAKVRVSSIDPHEVTDEMIDLFAASDVLCPHLHICIQSGSDRTLKRMARLYRRRVVDDVMDKLAQRIPHVAIGTDMIVGFPGETDADFVESCDVVANSPLSYAHVFPYSARKGTPATKLPDAVPPPLMAERASKLRAIADQKRAAFYRAQVGQCTEAIPEGRRDRQTGKTRAMTPHYIPVLIESPRGIREPETTRRAYRPIRILDATAHEVYAQWN
jgi:threonylcarbamoyladenosine tRNA methylthiotransferase MtaB